MYQAEDYYIAESSAQAADLLRANPKNAIIGGGMWMRTLNTHYHTLIDISRLGLNKISDRGDCIEIGAMTTLRQVEASPLLFSVFGDVFSDSLRPVVGVQFRNMATVGGSIFGKYAFSDLITVLLALDAHIVFQNIGAMPLQVYLSSVVEKDLLTAVRIPKDGRIAAYETLRISKTDFGVLNICLAKLTDGQWRVSIGSRPGRPMRCESAELLLLEGNLSGALDAVQAAPYSDCIRASGEYRRALARTLTKRAWNALCSEEVTE